MKALYCTGRVPGSGVTDYQCMTAHFAVSRDAGGIILTCPCCKAIHRMENLEAGQRVNVVTDRGIGDETFVAVVEGERLEVSTADDFAAAPGWENCGRTDCGDYDKAAKRHCKHTIINPDSCATFTPEILF